MKQQFVTSELSLEAQIQSHFITMNYEKTHKVKGWYKYQKPNTVRENRFLADVSIALEIINKSYKVSTMECGVMNGKIYYQRGATVEECFNCYEWEKKVHQFAPGYGSDIATVYEAALWYAYRVAAGFWTLDYVCNASYDRGNYRDSKRASLHCESAGARMIGGARDGIGNTYRLVKSGREFLLGGGCFLNLGQNFPVYHWDKCETPHLPVVYTSPMVVLRS